MNFVKRIALATLLSHFYLLVNSQEKSPEVKPIISTFLGWEQRNYYGSNAPDTLGIVWKKILGTGTTYVGNERRVWSGAGWTGQPLLIKENDEYFLIQGAYDHRLRKLSFETGETIWEYEYDDVLKGTGTFWENPYACDDKDKYIIFQGSRKGNDKSLSSRIVPSFRAISYMTGEELWRLNVKRDQSYSRDVDASPLIINDTMYIGLENGLFTVIDPVPHRARVKDRICQPQVLNEIQLYKLSDKKKHGGNLVTEASPAKLGDRIYVASGSGHIYGYNMKNCTIDWDFFIGSDIDGSTVVTKDKRLLVTVERQYIDGKGGVFKLNPTLPPSKSVEWFFPTENKSFAGWRGGIIGSVGINDNYTNNEKLAAFVGIDGNLYVVAHQRLDKSGEVCGPENINSYHQPLEIFRYETGPSISTPIFVDDKLIVCTYSGIYLFSYDECLKFTLLEKREVQIESTPIVFNGKIVVASRNGYLYCFGYK